MTRWAGLFADLEAQFEAADHAERAAEIEDRARIEAGKLRLIDRLRAATGLSLRLRCAGDQLVSGVLTRVGADWLLLDEGSGREALTLQAAVLSVSGLSRLVAMPESRAVSESRFGLAYALRGVARDRTPLRLWLVDGTVVDGTLDRVGADFIEVATHATAELRRYREVREILVIAFSGLSIVRRLT